MVGKGRVPVIRQEVGAAGERSDMGQRDSVPLEIYVDDWKSFISNGTMVKVELHRVVDVGKQDKGENAPRTIPVLRLSMPAGSFYEMCAEFLTRAKRNEKRVLDAFDLEKERARKAIVRLRDQKSET